MHRMTNYVKMIPEKPRRLLAAVFCTIFFCRRYFSEGISESIDSGWVWALNRAIHDGLVFGRDLVFTYGPLGFLSTRYTGFVGAWPLLMGDVILAAGFFYFVFRHAASSVPGLLVVLASVILLRNAYYVQALFSLFFIYTSLLFVAQKQTRPELVFAALYSVMLFFVKVNYGIIVPVFLFAGIGLLIARRAWESITWLIFSAVLFSSAILFIFHVSLPGYMHYGLSLIAGYEESMFLPMDIHSADYNAMVAFVAVAYLLALGYIVLLVRKNAFHVGHVFFVGFFALSVFLAYKNGITRFDGPHVDQFMAFFPFLVVSAMVISGGQWPRVALLLPAIMAVVAFLGTCSRDSSAVNVGERLWSLVSVHGYYGRLLKPSETSVPARFILDEEKRRRIATGTVDIIPHELYVAPANQLIYRGRPVCQSYSVYKPDLAALNTAFLLGAHAPERLLISGQVVDEGEYRGFYEPELHAAVTLNYDFEMTTLPGDSLPGSTNEYFLVFRRKSAPTLTPHFTPIVNQVVRLNDTVPIPVSSKPIYLKAELGYTILGKLNKLLLQPMPVTITFYGEDDQYYEYRLQLPMLESPVPVSRVLGSTRELYYYLSGREAEAKKITAFKITTHNREMVPEFNVVFYSFDNYKHVPPGD